MDLYTDGKYLLIATDREDAILQHEYICDDYKRQGEIKILSKDLTLSLGYYGINEFNEWSIPENAKIINGSDSFTGLPIEVMATVEDWINTHEYGFLTSVDMCRFILNNDESNNRTDPKGFIEKG